MSVETRIDRHADLVVRMADALGVDLAEEVMRGTVSPEEVRAAFLTCVSCSNPDGCETWLQAQTGIAEAAPDYCRNKARLEGLAPS